MMMLMMVKMMTLDVMMILEAQLFKFLKSNMVAGLLPRFKPKPNPFSATVQLAASAPSSLKFLNSVGGMWALPPAPSRNHAPLRPLTTREAPQLSTAPHLQHQSCHM
jgi:hypothetical protein